MRLVSALSSGRLTPMWVRALVWLAWSSSALAQIGDSKQAATAEPIASLNAGAEVVLKSSATPLFDVGHWVPSADQLSFLVERLQDDRIRVVSRRADLDQALRRDSINPTGQAVRVSYRPAQEEGDPEKSRKDRAETIEHERKQAVDVVARGKAHLAKQEYDDAIEDFTEAVRLDPAYAAAYAGRAEAWARKHYRDREVADFTVAIKLEPANTAYRVARAQSHSAQGRHEEAMADFNAALGTEPENPELWVARGNEWRRDLKLNEALADYSRAIQLKPDFTLAYISRGQTWRQRRDFGRAIQEFAEAARREPANALSHMYLARVLATCNDANSRNGKWAVDEATRACELTYWQDPDCLDTLAAACAENDDFPNAIKWQTRAIQRLRQKAPSILQRAMDFGGRKGIGFDDRLAFYKSRKPTRE